MKKFILFCLISISFVACSPKLSPDYTWADKKWVLTELSGTPVQLSGTDKDAHLLFMVKDQRISGTGGCNRIGGPYTIGKNNRLKFGLLISTKMACPDISFEDRFVAVLATVDSYKIKGEELLMIKGNEIVLKFK